MIRRILPFLIAASLAACTSKDATAPITGKPKPDPFVTIRVRDLLDTTTATGRAHWHVYVLLTGPQINQNGIAPQSNISLQDVRLGHNFMCVRIGADSVGQRIVSVIAVADTTTSAFTPDATAQAIVTDWYAGNTTLPSGWRALFNAPSDAWDSQQYLAGHGLIPSDPIRWGLDWTGNGIVNFYERAAADTSSLCSTF
jgi:hypothetical protein